MHSTGVNTSSLQNGKRSREWDEERGESRAKWAHISLYRSVEAELANVSNVCSDLFNIDEWLKKEDDTDEGFKLTGVYCLRK